MASVTSLGLHQPTALHYAIQEQLLPKDPLPHSYEWDIFIDRTLGGEIEDELLVTRDAVIWSRGCIFRKCFGFKLDKEPITQALLTYFPTSDRTRSPKHAPQLSRALVVFLQTQAHIYFLDGTSHVVHMPFQVESACAAPQGVIIQRRQRSETSVSIKLPRVPPNSFISPQVSPVSMRSSQPSTFNTETLGKPRALPLRLNANTDTLWDAPEERNDSRWPRLVTLTDPLLELGLVVSEQEKPAKHRSRRSSDKSPNFLDRAEEILHIEDLSPCKGKTERSPSKLVLAVTVNRETSMYSVWKLTYMHLRGSLKTEQKNQRRRSGPRRSSMLPSGATTPLQPNLKETFGAPLPGKRTRKSEKVEKLDGALETLESTLGLDKESGVTRRTSRRVSSMLARADLSASQDRAGFNEQPQMSGHTGSRRDTSHGNQRTRTSGAFSAPSFSATYNHQAMNSLGTFLEAPVDTLLEELRAGGDFEGFHSMGLDDHDFDGMTQEIILTKIHSIPIDNSNVRYSLSKQLARKQCKVFCVPGPQVPANEYERQQILVGIQDPVEKRLQLLTLHLQSTKSSNSKPGEADKTTVTFGQLTKAQNVIDSCKLVDGNSSMILMLSQPPNGSPQLSVQAPWSPFTPIVLPHKLSLANVRNLDYRGSLVNREVGIRRAVTPVVGEVGGMRHSKLRGVVDILEEDNQQLHQIRIQLQPASIQIRKILEVLGSVLPAPFSDNLLAGWCHVLTWLRHQDADIADAEWSAVIIQTMMLFLVLAVEDRSSLTRTSPRKRTRAFLRSSSGAQVELADWNAMNIYETPGSSTHPPWMEGGAWQWMMEEEDSAAAMFQTGPEKVEKDFLTSHRQFAMDYLSSDHKDDSYNPHEFLPAMGDIDDAGRFRLIERIFFALHLLLEDQKLSIISNRATPPDAADLRALLLMISKWMEWPSWREVYELELPLDWPQHAGDVDLAVMKKSPEPTYWGVLDWIQVNLSQSNKLMVSPPTISKAIPQSSIPRIRMFDTLFKKLSLKAQSPADFVVTMHDSGITRVILESLPEIVLVPLQDAIAQCQPCPPSEWSPGLLDLVNRSDIGSLLTPDNHGGHTANLITPTHHASWNFNSLCQNVMEFSDAPADDVAESDKQAVIRAIFKEDRRLDETKMMLNTTKPRSIRLDPLPGWTEAVYLEQQKEVVTRLATNTLSIPAGRGLMNYGLRFPLLTQKFHIHGFVLNCIVKPNNVTVGVDKTLFTEEKIAWAFFHSGVAGGLSISRQAKGIDTSWILYNKPGNDLNNRHAGFLLALGLNGHLKDVAKWVAFKYLTPKHTMTSIGLLLGLAASYIGTMDSLITRLLSVHVTRMLPRGAAELNLSPLTQTTGIMGIGLLYCNSQHRRMSEIMMSEIEHIECDDEEEPLRSECYRLAAGFALGFINLGKGTDLKGLHDMRITEKLLTLASTTKKVEHVHTLDRSSAAAVVAVTLIYMKSEDHIVARKIDVPEATLQFDYIRPDILLLRTVAKHLIMWSKIEPSHDWVRKNLPRRYHSRVQSPTQSFDHPSRGPLTSTHLPFLTILAGLCFSVALRFAGSGNKSVRDLLLSYLHRFYGLCRMPNPKATFDDRCVQVTARMCLDVVSLSCATVMAGTCDLKTLRILRSLHGRNNPETTYGSHLACHMAIGVLSLGCGTQTFNTSNLAIGSLLVAFYPVFPDTVQDNKSHLQAFRHFWVLATDPRCLVTKDVKTNIPVSIPITIRLKAERGSHPEEFRTTPCLLPPLSEIASLGTNSSEFWNLEINFSERPELVERFKKTQVLHLRRRPVSDNPFIATMLALGQQNKRSSDAAADDETHTLEWLFEEISSLKRLTHAERGIVLDSAVGAPDASDAAATVVDARLMLEDGIQRGGRDDLLGLKSLFDWVEWRAGRAQEDVRRKEQIDVDDAEKDENGTMTPGRDSVESRETISWAGDGWLRESVVEELKGSVWLAGRG
ncbi:hypothetical protein F5Y15DRAFT_366483 [Xylariaceae sp. FL0016]|nr:hypothetical protein F5Y15DRAFT_366483 [Xylariaceae sp. FL0016]